MKNFDLKQVGERENSVLIATSDNEPPVQVRCTILDALGWCTGTTQRDGMGREGEEGSGSGTHVYLWRIHFDIWQNQYNIVKLNKIKLKKNKINILL